MSIQERYTAEQLDDLRFELTVERARLERAMEAALAAVSAGSVLEAGSDERPVDAVVSTDVEARFDSVSSALERLDDGSYGLCNECGATIPYGRLIVMPEATHCVGCHPRG